MKYIQNMLLAFGLLWCSVALATNDALAQPSAADYRLGSGDLIKIHVFGEDDLTLQFKLGDSATISYPFLGELKLQGVTPGELEKLVYNGLLGDYLVAPVVNVSILAYRNFYIHGEVKKPGGYPFQPGMTLSKAVSLAGGFTDRASKTKIFTVHDFDRDKNKVQLDLHSPVMPGDIITVEQSFF